MTTCGGARCLQRGHQRRRGHAGLGRCLTCPYASGQGQHYCCATCVLCKCKASRRSSLSASAWFRWRVYLDRRTRSVAADKAQAPRDPSLWGSSDKAAPASLNLEALAHQLGELEAGRQATQPPSAAPPTASRSRTLDRGAFNDAPDAPAGDALRGITFDSD